MTIYNLPLGSTGVSVHTLGTNALGKDHIYINRCGKYVVDRKNPIGYSSILRNMSSNRIKGNRAFDKLDLTKVSDYY